MKESNQFRKTLIATAIAVILVPAAAIAVPQVNDEGRSELRVSYADLNLSSKSGLLTLYGRLRAASSAVCGPQNLAEAGSLAQLVRNKRCFESALSKAVSRINNAKLDAIHAS